MFSIIISDGDLRVRFWWSTISSQLWIINILKEGSEAEHNVHSGPEAHINYRTKVASSPKKSPQIKKLPTQKEPPHQKEPTHQNPLN